MRTTTILLLAMLACPVAVAQDPVPFVPSPSDVSVVEPSGVLSVGAPVSITYQVAGAAAVLERPDGRVMIVSEALEPKVFYGMVIPVENPKVKWVEAFAPGQSRAKTVYEQPGQPGSFLIEGKPGDKFEVRIPNGWDPPVWISIVIEGPDSGESPGDPPGSNDEITALSKARADALSDPKTRALLKSVVEKTAGVILEKCETGDCPDVQEAMEVMVVAIERDVMALREGESRDVEWKAGWRTPVGTAILALKPKSATEYAALMLDAAAGL